MFFSEEEEFQIEENGVTNYYCDIDKAKKNLSKSEAKGIDHIPSACLKQEVNSPLMIKLKEWFTDWIKKGTILKFLMIGKLISKESIDCPTLSNIRPITVLYAVIKYFENTIIHNLEKTTNSKDLSKWQLGFMKFKSTLNNISDIIKEASKLKEEKKKMESPMLVFFDFNKAYDSISRNLLLKKLTNYNMPWNIIRLIRWMLYNFKFKLGQKIIETKKGLIQGSVLSPLLFNIFINDLLCKYESKEIYARAHADDIVWVCKSMKQTIVAITIMKDWWSTNYMMVNKDKSGILRIIKRSGKITDIKIWLNILEVSTYKYLGININQSILL